MSVQRVKWAFRNCWTSSSHQFYIMTCHFCQSSLDCKDVGDLSHWPDSKAVNKRYFAINLNLKTDWTWTRFTLTGCKDIDDALHCMQLANGNFQVGVHIADVTNFVLPGTPLDEEASQRGTSVYLVDRRIDMLPKALTEGRWFVLCIMMVFCIVTVLWRELMFKRVCGQRL